jgi:nucleotide-binding universal stress UspA family protein
MKKILVPTDFSPTAEHAMHLALEIANKENATIYLLHVLGFDFTSAIELDNLFPDSPFEKEALDHFVNDGNNKMVEYLKNLKLQQANIEQVIDIGVPSDIIIEKIKELDIDLVVMGTHGSSGLKEFFIGSNAEKVVRYAQCPVITVKHKTSIKEINKIAFGSDLIEISEKVMEKLKQLQNVFDADIAVVRINTPNNFERDVVIKVLSEKILKRFLFKKVTIHIFNDYTIEQGLLNFADEIGAGMIALATHGRKGLGHIVAGSIAEDITNHATKAVWTNHFN